MINNEFKSMVYVFSILLRVFTILEWLDTFSNANARMVRMVQSMHDDMHACIHPSMNLSIHGTCNETLKISEYPPIHVFIHTCNALHHPSM